MPFELGQCRELRGACCGTPFPPPLTALAIPSPKPPPPTHTGAADRQPIAVRDHGMTELVQDGRGEQAERGDHARRPVRGRRHIPVTVGEGPTRERPGDEDGKDGTFRRLRVGPQGHHVFRAQIVKGGSPMLVQFFDSDAGTTVHINPAFSSSSQLPHPRQTGACCAS
jgi:hypothetical protein